MIGKRKTKNLFNLTTDNVTLHIQCYINENNDNIGIYTGFQRTSNGGSVTNKTCTDFLGIHIAERVLSYIYPNVTRMTKNNAGYDFICGNGYKIDVKSSCLQRNRLNQWHFTIKKNKIADYFLCLAFDNREDLNPLHLWLIPGHVINHLYGTEISKSTLNRWFEYEQSLDKILTCCNKMKSRGNNDYNRINTKYIMW